MPFGENVHTLMKKYVEISLFLKYELNELPISKESSKFPFFLIMGALK